MIIYTKSSETLSIEIDQALIIAMFFLVKSFY